ncbi:MAG: IPT/TIG domain-containing protein, partial [Pyrinomonadaceae bacterium]
MLLGVGCMLLPVLLVYFLFKVFPPVPWPKDPNTSALVGSLPISFFNRTFSVATTLEERLLLLVIIAGALGSYVHAATSFADYVGNKKFTSSWTWWYLLRPFIGVALALILYFAIRGGFLLLVTSGAEAADNINPFGVAALAALTGMFSKQATDKLDEVFSALFKTAPGKGDDKRADSLIDPLTVSGITPDKGPTTGGTSVTLTGTGFMAEAAVTFGDVSATGIVVGEDGKSITAVTPPHPAGKVD